MYYNFLLKKHQRIIMKVQVFQFSINAFQTYSLRNI